MNDKEYLTYLKEKTFEELEDIYSNFNKSQNRVRFEVIEKFLTKKKRKEPELFAEYARQIRYKTIGKRIGASFIDGFIIWLSNILGIYLVGKFSH